MVLYKSCIWVFVACVSASIACALLNYDTYSVHMYVLNLLLRDTKNKYLLPYTVYIPLGFILNEVSTKYETVSTLCAVAYGAHAFIAASNLLVTMSDFV